MCPPDPESDMLQSRTRWAVGSTAGNVDVVAWTPSSEVETHNGQASLNGIVPSSLLTHAHTYYVTLEATNGAGTTVVYPQPPHPITMDFTAPTLRIVHPRLRKSPNGGLYWPRVDYLTLHLNAADEESGVVSLRARVVEVSNYEDAFLNRTGTMISPWVEVQLDSNSSFSGSVDVYAVMDRGAAYSVEVEALNGASTLTFNTSLVFLPDDTPPNCTALHDWINPAEDRNFINVMTQVAAAWICEDHESRLARNQWSANISGMAVSTSGSMIHGPPLFPLTNLGDAPMAVTEDYVIVHGSVVRTHVRAANGAGLVSHLHSTGIFYDETPPVAGRVLATDFTPFDGVPEHVGIAFQTSTQELSVALLGFLEPESGPLQCAFETWCSRDGAAATIMTGQRTHPSSCARLPERATSTLSSPSTPGVDLWLAHGDVCWTAVVVTNQAGGDVQAVTGQVVIDETPPVVEHFAATAMYGTLTADDILASNYAVDDITIIATVEGVGDPESGIEYTNVTVSNAGGLLDHKLVVGRPNASAVNYTFVVDVVDARKPVIVATRAVNGARNDVVVKVLLFIEVPLLAHGVVADGPADVAATQSIEPGVWPAGLTPLYYDSSGFTNDPTSVWLSWFGFTNPAESVNFTWGLCLNASCPAVDTIATGTRGLLPSSTTSSGSGSAVVIGTTSLQHGQFYRAVLNATDTAGNWVSNLTAGFLVDVTAPMWPKPVTVATFNASSGASVWNNTLLSRPSMSLEWVATDPESSIDQVVLMLGTMPRGSDIVAPVFQPGLSRSFPVSLCVPDSSSLGDARGIGCVPDSALLRNVSHQDTVHATVFARNRAGTWAIASESGPITIDDTACTISVVPVTYAPCMHGTSTGKCTQEGSVLMDLQWKPVVESINGTERVRHVSYVRTASSLGFRWNTRDRESTVASVEWCAGTAPGSEDIMPWTTAAEDVGSVRLGDAAALQGNDTAEVYFTVHAINALGIRCASYSNRVVIDATPPHLVDPSTTSRGVRCSTLDTDALEATSRSISATWDAYTDAESGVAAFVWWAVQAITPADDIAVHRNVSSCVARCLARGVFVTPCVANCSHALDMAEGVVAVVPPRVLSSSSHRDAVSGLPLTQQTLYQAHLAVVNHAGGWTLSSSPLFAFDSRAPAVTGGRLQLLPTARNALSGSDYVKAFHPRLEVTGSFVDVATVSTIEWEVVRFRAGQGIRPPASSRKGVLALSAPNLKSVDVLASGRILVNTTTETEGTPLDNTTVSLLYVPHGERLVVQAVGRGMGGVPSPIVSSRPFIVDASAPIPGHISMEGTGFQPSDAPSLGIDIDNIWDTVASSDSVPVLPARRDAVVNVSWAPFADAESPIVQYTVCYWVERLPPGLGCCNTTYQPNASAAVVVIPGPAGCPCRQPAAAVGNRTCTNMTGDTQAFSAAYLELEPHLQVVQVGGTNAAGLTVWSERVEAIVDPTPPFAGIVLDGPESFADEDFTTADDSITATFDCFIDHESGILGYVWSAFVDGTAVVQNEWVGDVRSVAKANVQLPREASVVVYVTAISRAGAFARNASDGVVVLPTRAVAPPRASVEMLWNTTKPYGVVLWPAPLSVGPSMQQVVVTSETHRVGVAWAHFGEVSPQFVTYEWTVCPQSRVLLGGTSALTSTSCLLPFLPVRNRTRGAGRVDLQPGVKYVGVVRATTAAGLKTTVFTRNVLAGDDTPPIVGGVFHGAPVARRQLYQSNCTHLHVWWEPSHDWESGVAEYAWSLGTDEEPENLLRRTPFNGSDPASAVYHGMATGLEHACSLPLFTTIVATLYVTNGAQLESTTVSSGVFIDPTPPTPGNVFVNFERSVAEYQKGDAGVQASWTRFVDDESGISVRVLRFGFVVVSEVAGAACLYISSLL